MDFIHKDLIYKVNMYYIKETTKTFNETANALKSTVLSNGFGVLHVHDLGATLRNKGVAFEEQCQVFEVCNPSQAAKVLATDMQLNMALPCRISVYTEHGHTKIGFIKPQAMLASLSQDPTLVEVGKEVEAKMIKIVDEAS
jgi:uncharacterized protein (DUF302 family)